MRIAILALMVLASLHALTMPSSGANSANVSVSVEILTSTTVNAAGCAPNSADRTDFGAILGATDVVTSLDCVVGFGGNAETSLRMYQGDGGGVALRAEPSSGLVADWSFNDSYDDRSATANTVLPGSGSAEPTFGAGAPDRGRALVLDGDAVADATYDSAYDLDVFTVEAWFDVTTLAPQQYSPIIRKQNGAGDRNFAITFDRDANRLYATASFAGNTENVWTDATPWVATGWHHVAMTLDAGGTMVLYVDGVERGRGTFVGNVDNSLADVQIGRQVNGSIDEVRIHSVARSASELRSYYLGTVDDYVTGGATDKDWSAAAGTTMFGACLRSTEGDATTDADTWTADATSTGDESAATADCGDGDSDPWRAIPGTNGSAARIAFAPIGSTTAVANLRFGLRTSSTLPAGTYVAPIRFEAVAPDVPNSPPFAAALVSPSDTRTVGRTPTLVATFDDPEGATGTLEFEVCTAAPTPGMTCADAGGTVAASGSSSSGIADGSNGSWVVSPSVAAGTYYWRARGIDSSSATGPWSAVYQFVASATPIYYAGASTASTSSTALVLNKPAGAEIGDVMIAQVASDDATTTFGTPAGWTLLRDNPSATMHQASYYRVVDGSEPASWSWSSSVSEDMGGGIMLFSGVDTSSPIDAHSAGASSSSGTSAIAPGVTTTVANTMLVALYGLDNGVNSSAAPAGMTERWDTAPGSGGMGAVGANGAYVGPGATGDRTATIGSSHWVAILVALRPQA